MQNNFNRYYKTSKNERYTAEIKKLFTRREPAENMKVKQTLFTANTAMEKYFDEYDHYNFDPKLVEPQTRKGRSKRESAMNTNRTVPAGHERKVAQKLQNAEKNSRKMWAQPKEDIRPTPDRMTETTGQRKNPVYRIIKSQRNRRIWIAKSTEFVIQHRN